MHCSIRAFDRALTPHEISWHGLVRPGKWSRVKAKAVCLFEALQYNGEQVLKGEKPILACFLGSVLYTQCEHASRCEEGGGPHHDCYTIFPQECLRMYVLAWAARYRYMHLSYAVRQRCADNFSEVIGRPDVRCLVDHMGPAPATTVRSRFLGEL